MITKKRLVIYSLSVLALVFLGSGILILQQPSTDKLRVAFLAVGQGDAILIRTPTGRDLLIDGGPDRLVLSRIAEILPWYDRQIDAVFLTHNHLDHYGGLLSVFDNYQVGQFFVSSLAEPLPSELAAKLAERKINYQELDAGSDLQLESKTELKVLWPKASTTLAEMNDRSLVLELSVDQIKFLFAGDAGALVEEALLKAKQLRPVQVFKLSHHGSDTANSQRFLELLSPNWVVAQAGLNNSFGHPNLRVLKRAERLGAQVLRNDLDGTVVFETDGKEVDYHLIK